MQSNKEPLIVLRGKKHLDREESRVATSQTIDHDRLADCCRQFSRLCSL